MINIKTDSRKIIEGDTFVAIKGMTVDGHDFIDKAIANGATKIIAEKGDYSVETIIVPDTKVYLEDYLETTYKDMLNNMKFIAVTGTNGKTTTAYLAYQILNKLEYKTAYIGSNGFYIAGDMIKPLDNTTPEITEIYSLILEAYDNSCSHLIMETSSHAIDQRRIAGIKFDAAAFTNLTQDHLDYHKNMEDYLDAKLNLLSYMKIDGKFITNVDDPAGNRFCGPNTKTIGFNGEDYKIINFTILPNSTLIEFNYNNEIYKVEINLLSKFNIYNYIEALALVHELGVSISDIINITKEVYSPKGRCEIIQINNSKAVIDYACTPDSVEKIITAFIENKQGKIITILGCGGDRDALKRPIMGNIATSLSDYVIFTNDNPRTEDEKIIMDNIIAGVNSNNYEIEHNRRIAIRKGIDMLKENDILLVLGKGHEDYQIIGKEKMHFDDGEEVREYIKNFNI